ncbi:hypothetical protein RI129_010747 [Pyrocoelia pectoralis]|uniref:Uncharacterized protein n=1 Tax=Pyrocoelia pectoralis TaxID=417401 RepID=A0AAN7ZGR8_9COLE
MGYHQLLFVLLVLTTATAQQQPAMSCSYKGRGYLTSICVNAIPSLFRTTAYRFDNLDENLQCVNCTLQVIESYTFDISGNQIKNLDLTDSKITILKPKSFMGLVFLEKLILKDNQIVSVPAETFQGITKVKDLNMENNRVDGLVVNGFKELANLRKLNLKSNNIKSIEDGSFNGLGSLEELDLSNNEITTVNGIFTGLLNVRLINLEKNKISKIDPLDVQQLSVLLYLNLARNNLKNILNNTFLELPRLESLNLSSNPIEVIELGSFRGLDGLEELDMSSCLIETIQKGLLLTLHRLRLLNLSYNRLKVFKTGLFSGLPELRKLNMSHNKISTYEKTGIFPLHSLHNLDLSSNNLTDLDYKLLVDHLPALSHIGLEDNPLPCYLKKEMEEIFKHDNLIFSLGAEAEDPNIKCATPIPVPPEDVTEEEIQRVTVKAPLRIESSNGHQYVLYIFIAIALILMSLLFYLQYRNRSEINKMVGRTNVSETRLISSELEDGDIY